jgi:hypothetical protein
MSARIELLGQRFGQLVVIGGPGAHWTAGGQRKTTWQCLCDCGTEVWRTQTLLRKGQSTHCGCSPAPRQRLPMIGRRFDRLVVIGEAEPGRQGDGRPCLRWRCRCDCGNEITVDGRGLRSGASRSCGCRKSEAIVARFTTHGHTRGGLTPEYQAWRGMKTRCLNPRHHKFPDYGGRGIRVCDEWINSFEAFLAHIGPRPSPEMSVDRIDVDGHYEPGNVRWATPLQQRHNRRDSQPA